jgi:hypothetical protein
MRLLLFIALFSLIGLITPAFSQNQPSTSTYQEAVVTAKECKKAVDQDSSKTEAEKIVAKRKCSIESTKKIVGNVEAKSTRLYELQSKNLVQCETWYDHYQITDEKNFKILKPRQLADDCIILYNDEIWQYSGEDRFQKLLTYALELDLFKIAKIKAKLPESGLSPFKQLKAGIPKTHVDCKDGFVLIYKITTKKPYCINLDSVEKIFQRNWGTLKLSS